MKDEPMKDERIKNFFSSLIAVSSLIALPVYALAQRRSGTDAKGHRDRRRIRPSWPKQTGQLEAELAACRKSWSRWPANAKSRSGAVGCGRQAAHPRRAIARPKNDALKAQQKNLAALVQAALRLSRTPPEAMVMMPGDVDADDESGARAEDDDRQHQAGNREHPACSSDGIADSSKPKSPKTAMRWPASRKKR